MASIIEAQAYISRVVAEPRSVDHARAMRNRLNATNQEYFLAPIDMTGNEQGMEP